MPQSYATASSLASDLRALGLRTGDVVLMHSSLRSLGFVVGGAQSVVEGLLDVLRPSGTLVVPTHTPENTDPAHWSNPPVPESWWAVIRDKSPGFDPAVTPAGSGMGRLSELVRTWPGARRSNHPHVSFAALGARADDVVAAHRLDDALGEASPLGAVYRLDGSVLLLGCGHQNNTSIHLAEWRRPAPPRHVVGARVRRPDGSSTWQEWEDVAEDADDFGRIGGDFEGAESTVTDSGTAAVVRIGKVGSATARLMSQRSIVDYATDWMARNRT